MRFGMQGQLGAGDCGQLHFWPGPEQLLLPEQLMLELPKVAALPADRIPAGVVPIPAPDAPAALGCVENVLDHAADALGIPKPEVRWFRATEVPQGVRSYQRVGGFAPYDDWAIWLNVSYRSPNDLARTVAHEVAHQWQHARRGRALDEIERVDRESEAQRRAELLVPDGTFRMPRGRAGDAWLLPERRRYQTP